MRRFLVCFGLLLGLVIGVWAAEPLTLTLGNGTSLTGDVVKSDDIGVMVHTTSDSYTNIQWREFSQDSLKTLAANPKLTPLAQPFIEPAASALPSGPKITIKEVTRMTLPAHPSILGGMFHSSLGLFILLVVYGANIYAGYEIAKVRGKPVAIVVGSAVVLPIIGPIIFLAQPMEAPQEEGATPEEAPPGAPGTPGAPTPAGAAGQEEIQIVAASWQASEEEKKPQPQVFTRGKFTLNKRFIETKFAGFIGEPKGEAKTFSMEIKTLKETLAVECIKQVGATEAILETPKGQLTVAFAEIQEIKLIPKTA